MIQTIYGLIIGLVLFLCAYTGFKQGLRLGMNTSKGVIPKPIRNPLTVIDEIKLTKEQRKKQEEEQKWFDEMLAFNGERKKVTNES